MFALSRLSSSRLSCALLQARVALCSSAEARETVCFTDPALLWGQQEAATETASAELAKTHFHATIPSSLANKLHEAKFSLGDGDTPEGSWVVGKQGELFEYKLVGVHKVQSGYSAVLRCRDGTTSALPAIPEDEHEAIKCMMKKGASKQALAGGSVLFLGELVDCETASVYVHKKGTSLMITSNHEGF